MADNVAVKDANNATVNIASDDVGGAQIERVKPVWGVDGAGVDASVTNPLPVQLVPQATNGLSTYKLITAASTNAQSVKGSAGQLYGYHLTNEAGAFRYVKLYAKATAPTVGSDTPKLTLGLPPGSGACVMIPTGVAFALGIGLAVTANEADNDATAVAASDVTVNLFYA